MASSARHAQVTLASQWLRFAIQILGFVLLSRLLPPEDFGLVAIVAVVSGFATLVADFGLSLASLQVESLSRIQKSNLFWLNSAAGVVGMGLVVLCAPLLVWLNADPRLFGISLGLSIVLLLNSVAVQFRVELNRRHRFTTLAVQDVVSASLGLSAAIAIAVAGGGYWSLVAQPVAQALTLLVLATWQANWFPGWPSFRAPMRELLGFGRDTFALQILNFASRSTDVLALGRLQGPTDVGYYSRATQMVSMAIQQLISPLTRVILPRLARADEQQFADRLVTLQRIISVIPLAALSALVSLSDALVPVLLGQDWIEMVPALQILSAAAAFQALTYVYYWASLARARTMLLLASEFPGRLIMILGALWTAQWGISAVAWCIFLGQFAMWIAGALYVAPRLRLDRLQVLSVSALPAAVAGAAALATIAIDQVWLSPLLGQASWLRFSMLLVIWSALVGCSYLSTRYTRRILTDVLRGIKGS